MPDSDSSAQRESMPIGAEHLGATGSFESVRPMIREFIASLFESIAQMMSGVSSGVVRSGLEDEASAMPQAVFDHVRAILRRTGIENEELAAAIQYTLARCTTEMPSTGKIHAEASNFELRDTLQQMLFSCGACKCWLAAEADEEAIILNRQIDSFIKFLQSFAPSGNG